MKTIVLLITGGVIGAVFLYVVFVYTAYVWWTKH